MAFCLGCYYLGGLGLGWRWEFIQKSSMFLFLKNSSAVIDITTKVAYLLFMVCRNMASIWFHMAPGDSVHLKQGSWLH